MQAICDLREIGFKQVVCFLKGFWEILALPENHRKRRDNYLSLINFIIFFLKCAWCSTSCLINYPGNPSLGGPQRNGHPRSQAQKGTCFWDNGHALALAIIKLLIGLCWGHVCKESRSHAAAIWLILVHSEEPGFISALCRLLIFPHLQSVHFTTLKVVGRFK